MGNDHKGSLDEDLCIEVSEAEVQEERLALPEGSSHR